MSTLCAIIKKHPVNNENHGSYIKILPELGMTVESAMRMQVNFEINLPNYYLESTKNIAKGKYIFPFIHTEIIMDVTDLQGRSLDEVQMGLQLMPKLVTILLMLPMGILGSWFLMKQIQNRFYKLVPNAEK